MENERLQQVVTNVVNAIATEHQLSPQDTIRVQGLIWKYVTMSAVTGLPAAKILDELKNLPESFVIFPSSSVS